MSLTGMKESMCVIVCMWDVYEGFARSAFEVSERVEGCMSLRCV